MFALRVTGSHDRTIRIWSTVTWECEGIIQGHEGTKIMICFLSDQFLNVYRGKMVIVWL